MSRDSTEELLHFVLARIAEREAVARLAAGGFPDWIDGNEETLDGENVYFTVTATRGAGKAGAEWEPDYFLSVHEDRRDSARAAHIARWDPTAVLARCAVDRQVVQELADLEQEIRDVCALDLEAVPVELDTRRAVIFRVVLLLASLDAEHPYYDESWRP